MNNNQDSTNGIRQRWHQLILPPLATSRTSLLIRSDLLEDGELFPLGKSPENSNHRLTTEQALMIKKASCRQSDKPIRGWNECRQEWRQINAQTIGWTNQRRSKYWWPAGRAVKPTVKVRFKSTSDWLRQQRLQWFAKSRIHSTRIKTYFLLFVRQLLLQVMNCVFTMRNL